MFQQTPNKRVLFPHTLTSVVTGLFAVATILYGGFAAFAHPPRVYAATNANLNFQARLEGSGGAIAADGYYNVQFKLYTSSTVVGTPDPGACTRNGGTPEPTCLWTESYYDSNGVT